MGYYDGSTLPMWKWAQEYTLADNFFMGAFGGSYLNHFWLICACTPIDADAPPNLRAQLDERGWLKTRPTRRASALTGAGEFVRRRGHAGRLFASTRRSRRTSRRACRRRRAAIARFADPAKHTLPPQTQTTIGDTLSAKGISWAWYAGAWDAALKDGMQPPDAPRKVIATRADGAPYFVTHHQPFNYFARFAPGTAGSRSSTSRTTTTSSPASTQGTLPQVVFYKPQGIAQPASGLRRHPVGRRAHRRARREDQGEPAVGVDGDHRDLRRERRLLGSRARRRRAIAGVRARAFRRSSFRRTRSAATSITRPTTRRRSSSSSRGASTSSRCRACARAPAT